MSTNQRKGGSKVGVAETVPVRTAVAKAMPSRVRELDSVEERVLRTRHGVGVDPSAPLGRKADGEVLDELLLFELEVRKRYMAHLAKAKRPQAKASSAKDKIVRTLRKKK